MNSVLIATYSTVYNEVEVRLYPFGLDITHRSGNDKSLTCKQHYDMVALRPVNGWPLEIYAHAPAEQWDKPRPVDLVALEAA